METGNHTGKETILLTSVGIEPTTSRLDQPLLCRLSYTSELIPCSTICVHSATRHNIHMYPYFLFAAIHHLISSDLVAQSQETVYSPYPRRPECLTI